MEVTAADGTLGMLAGVTGDIEKHWATVRKLGDRWVFVRPEAASNEQARLEVALAATRATGDEDRRRQKLKDAVRLHTGSLDILRPEQVECSDEHRIAIVKAADWLARLRTPIDRDQYTKEVSGIPEPEGPARLAKAFFKLAAGLASVRGRGRIEEEDVETVFRIARDSAPTLRGRVLDAVGVVAEVGDVSNALGISDSTVRRYLEELRMLGFVSLDSDLGVGKGRPAINWRSTDAGLVIPSLG